MNLAASLKPPPAKAILCRSEACKEERGKNRKGSEENNRNHAVVHLSLVEVGVEAGGPDEEAADPLVR